MEKRFNFYVIVGQNGVCVADAYEEAAKLKTYISNSEIRGFSELNPAKTWALEQFRERSGYGHFLKYRHLQLNCPIFNSNLYNEYIKWRSFY